MKDEEKQIRTVIIEEYKDNKLVYKKECKYFVPKDEQQQIEEMANAIFDYVDTQKKDHVYICNNKASELAKPFLHNTAVAEFMYKRGYRKQSDTVREFVQKLKAEDERCRKLYSVGAGMGFTTIAKIAEEYGVKKEDL